MPEGISKADVDQFGRGLFAGLNEPVIERGITYYLDGRVASIECEDAVVFGEVRGQTSYRVTFDMVENTCECTCPYTEKCKHMVAVFLDMYEEYGEPDVFLARLHSPLDSTSTDFRGASVVVFAPQNSPLEMGPPLSTDSVSGWLAYLEKKIPFTWNGGYYDYSRGLLDAVDDALRVSDDWDDAVKAAYRLVANLYMIRQTSAILDAQTTTEYHAHVVERVAQRSLREIERVTQGLLGQPEGNVSPKHLRDIHDYVGWIVQRSGRAYTWALEAWLLLYDAWFRYELSLTEELSYWADKIAEDAETNDHQSTCKQFVLAHLYLLADQDEAAMALLQHHDVRRDPNFYLYQLECLGNEQAWSRLHDWLSWVSQHQLGKLYRFIEALCGWWIQLAEHHREAVRDCESFLRSHAPFTEGHLLNFYISTEQYRTLVEHYLVRGALPNEIHRDILKEIERSSLADLLPLYHQAVERCVRLKNRAAYKLAVRFLKKLSTWYKKLKRQEEWEEFLERFTAKYSRLRALQEEMRKRGLIT